MIAAFTFLIDVICFVGGLKTIDMFDLSFKVRSMILKLLRILSESEVLIVTSRL